MRDLIDKNSVNKVCISILNCHPENELRQGNSNDTFLGFTGAIWRSQARVKEEYWGVASPVKFSQESSMRRRTAETAQRFNNELTCLLGDLDGSVDINKHWNNIKSSLHTAAEKILGEPKKQNKLWISHETLALIDKRSRAKLSKAKLRREIKKAVRVDKARYYSELTDEVIAADESGNTRKCTLSSRSSDVGPISTDISPTKKKKLKLGQIISRTC